MRRLGRKELDEIIDRLRRGGKLMDESRRLYFQSNGPLRSQLREYMGEASYNALMAPKRPTSREGHSILPAAKAAREQAAQIERVKIRLATIEIQKFEKEGHEFTRTHFGGRVCSRCNKTAAEHTKPEGEWTARVLADGQLLCDCPTFNAGKKKGERMRACQHIFILAGFRPMWTKNYDTIHLKKYSPAPEDRNPKDRWYTYSGRQNRSFKNAMRDNKIKRKED